MFPDPMEHLKDESPEVMADILATHYRRTQDTYTCPACGLEAVYNAKSDRFFHLDGSDNQDCWLHMCLDDPSCPFHTADDRADVDNDDPVIRWRLGVPQ